MQPPKPRRAPERPTTPRPVTAIYLRRAALHYLSQRTASVAMLRLTLERRAAKRLLVGALPPETVELIEAAVAELQTLGLVDDLTFAGNRAASLAGKGLSRRRIGIGLRQKGIAAETIAAAIEPDLDDLVQAKRYVQRKRLGSFRRDGVTPETRTRDLRALARAGFGYGIAARALDEAD